ncbi:MAG: hypothetical protein KGJ86_18710, partial [Chloroflexota bacterium]|nr:hypothetical protein [Chloroflexota bacterium]
GTHELMRLAGYPVKALRVGGFDIPLVETGCKYYVPGYFEDLVEIETAVTDVRAKSFRLGHRCLRKAATVCEGFEWRAYVDISHPEAIHAVPIPDGLSRALQGEPVAAKVGPE